MTKGLSMNEFEFNLSELFLVLKRKIIIVLLCSFIVSLAFGIYTACFIEDKYQSSATLFPQLVVTGDLIDYEQLNANNALLNTYVELLKSSDVISKVAQKLNTSYSTVHSSLSVWKGSSTQLITISASTNNAVLSKNIVDNVLSVFYEDIAPKIDVSNIITVSEAKLSTTAISANLTESILTGASIGTIISIVFIYLQFFLDNRIHNKAEAEAYFNLPVLGIIPDMENMYETR